MREYDALGREPFLAKYGFGKATKFVVVDGGREYDSKAVLAAAHGFEHPDEGPLSAHGFSGGGRTTSRLRALGFIFAAPSVSPSPVRLVRQAENRDGIPYSHRGLTCFDALVAAAEHNAGQVGDIGHGEMPRGAGDDVYPRRVLPPGGGAGCA